MFSRFFQGQQFRIAREFPQCFANQTGCFYKVVHANRLINLGNPAAFGVRFYLICTTAAQALQLHVQTRVLRVNIAQAFPLSQRVGKLPDIFKRMGPGDDGIHQALA